jgi:hypothetical protein
MRASFMGWPQFGQPGVLAAVLMILFYPGGLHLPLR